MDKKTVKIAAAVIAVSFALIIALFAYKNAKDFTHRLEKSIEYEEILFRHGEYALLKLDSDSAAFICHPGAEHGFGGWDRPFSVYAEVDLSDHSLREEYFVMKSMGPYNNSYIAEASREHYVYMTHNGRKQGVPEFNLYMGISSSEPSYDNTGAAAEQLQYVELNGLYYFLFLEDFNIG